jgi:hypothetical protein
MSKKSFFILVWISAVFISILFAYLAHVKLSSPAFQADFSMGLKPSVVMEATHPGDIKPELPSFGFRIESLRTVIIAILILLSIPTIYPGVIEETPTAGLITAVACVAIMVSICCLFIFPNNLAAESKIWKTLSTEPEHWKNLSSRWEAENGHLEWLNEKNELKPFLTQAYGEVKKDEALQPEDKALWVRMYRSPYRWYLPYAIANFALLATPFLIFCLIGARKDFIQSSKRLDEVENIFRKPVELEDIEQLRPSIEGSHMMLSDTMDRYLWLILLLVSMAFFEARFGYLTLSNSGAVFVFATISSFFLAYIALAPRVLGHHNALRQLKFKLLDIEKHIDRTDPAQTEALLKRITLMKKELTTFDFTFSNSLQSISKLAIAVAGLAATIDQITP